MCRCETLYKQVEDTEYREECAVDVQHVCEHHVPVPVPVEVKLEYFAKHGIFDIHFSIYIYNHFILLQNNDPIQGPLPCPPGAAQGV